jgi:hypothetical protein
VSTSSSYTFTVTADRTLVAKFKPVYVVTVVANPPQGGDPEVDAFYELNELAKLKSKPNNGWSLVNWTQNGVVVSTDIDFSFNVTGNRDLVANYAFGKRIDLLADPKTAGNVSGEGVFPTGTSVTVTAEARPGYIFLDWTEFDTPVSTDADYTFTSEVPRLLTARFAALPSIAIAPAPAPGQLVFTWPDVPNWVLKESPDLVTWTTSTRTVTASGGQKSVTVTTDEGRVFFRLAYQ